MSPIERAFYTCAVCASASRDGGVARAPAERAASWFALQDTIDTPSACSLRALSWYMAKDYRPQKLQAGARRRPTAPPPPKRTSPHRLAPCLTPSHAFRFMLRGFFSPLPLPSRLPAFFGVAHGRAAPPRMMICGSRALPLRALLCLAAAQSFFFSSSTGVPSATGTPTAGSALALPFIVASFAPSAASPAFTCTMPAA